LENPLPETSTIPPQRTTTQIIIQILWEIVQTLLLAALLYFVIDSFIGRVKVQSISMQPTLHADELIIVNKLAYRLGKPERGDIITFHHPLNPQEDLIKRVIGLPGDTITIQNRKVTVNGIPLKEDYIAEPPTYSGEWLVPEGKLFVLGDNRNQSSDSHRWGFVSMENVIGRALIVYWPLSDLRILSHPNIVQASSTP
jgi:signal peptidase I